MDGPWILIDQKMDGHLMAETYSIKVDDLKKDQTQTVHFAATVFRIQIYYYDRPLLIWMFI